EAQPSGLLAPSVGSTLFTNASSELQTSPVLSLSGLTPTCKRASSSSFSRNLFSASFLRSSSTRLRSSIVY
ncbi:hypothetical protein TNIN_108591, partial [Trichonephila inaurata madagascariensis]